ncbi:hypothetical protein A1Q2_01513 [Trichosporon asahii var. asahii CBS 8904]|uniref:RecQ-mediated genome instability protein 1 n=1 Tax=Trichosporon asahii var. asahii (strain CBS 8904) TaxID=1220162 RepID=K1VXG6_TRIAC|nr:hypothetical protein A1Q2_01513 [Trichosporon asahii var. asahii CBS 8904]
MPRHVGTRNERKPESTAFPVDITTTSFESGDHRRRLTTRSFPCCTRHERTAGDRRFEASLPLPRAEFYGQDASYENVEAAYLDSDLNETTLNGVIPQELNDGVLFPRPTLLQLHSITEIGASAFALNTAREQRREVLSGATRIRGIDDDDEDDIDDSKLPAYPRSMLSVEVSDGRSTIRAIEYRKLPELALGETRLGLKMMRGRLLLEPKNCTVIGGCVDELEEGQPQAFVEGLEKRLHTARAPVSAAASAEARAARAAAIRAAMENPDPQEERARPAPVTQITGAPSSATGGPSSGSFANPTVISDDEDEFDDFDDSFIRAIDEVEAAGMGAAASIPRMRSQPTQRSSGRSTIPADAEIIELSDSD